LLIVIGVGEKWLCSMLGKFYICSIFWIFVWFWLIFKQKIWI